MRLRFVLSEMAIGLRRNLTMTVAFVLVAAVSLAAFGGGLLLREQIATMKDYWYDKVEVSIFLCGQGSASPSCAGGPVSDAQRRQLEADLYAMPAVAKVYYESQQDAFARFREQFKDAPDLVRNVTPDALPESYRVKLNDPRRFGAVAAAMRGRPGVEEVVDQRKLLSGLFRALNTAQVISLAVALALLAAAVLLIGVTMRVAAFSRRRETGIMRLVGASNLYIRLPFLLEAAVAGLIGGVLASGLLVAVQVFVINRVLRPAFTFTAFIGWDDVWPVVAIVIALGVGVSALVSAASLQRYLRV